MVPVSVNLDSKERIVRSRAPLVTMATIVQVYVLHVTLASAVKLQGYVYVRNVCFQCQKGRFGMNCTQTCSCSAQSTGCDPETGECNCLPGYTGEQCEHSCPRGTWGQGCNNVCKDVCSTMGTETCSPINGACRCKPGYTGMNCSSACPTGSWGRNCVNTCTCNGRGKCDLVTGSCDCDPGYNGSSCQTVCSSTQSWGKRCSHLCNCNGAPCNPVDGRCECPAGKKGHHCEQECSAYYFGINCVQPCRCQNGAICDKTTGACTCQPGWAGTFCENKCDDGYFGAGCDQQCPVCYHGGSCDPATGQCQCAAGYTGINCQQMCPVGYYGVGCGSKCPSVCPHNCQPDVGVCKCTPGSCLNGGVCNSQGVCQCAAGYEGDRCSQTTGQSARLVNQAPQSGGNNSVSLSNGSVAGLAVGIVVAIALMAILIVLGMRRYYTGRFLRSATAVRYDHRDSVNEPDDDDDGMRGFSNPQYEESRENRVAAELSSPTHENETDS
ncbi:hypothetical protein FSP39_000120 [Pinctada imbricata]|uniref:Multiple epidermal growth factor-like domains protein 10 n=1 Tax=Pinctada imbricata TaxID=66713 RepID=A0AA88YIF9_PINIB|nr:hypothetical protein FSP39_000120 [Pinctada imbricata]